MLLKHIILNICIDVVVMLLLCWCCCTDVVGAVLVLLGFSKNRKIPALADRRLPEPVNFGAYL